MRRFGWNAAAFQTVESGYSYFFHGEDGCVAYAEIGRAWVAVGAPIAAPPALRHVAAAFVDAARARGKRCCFFAAEDRLRDSAQGLLCSLRIGEQPVWPRRAVMDVVERCSRRGAWRLSFLVRIEPFTSPVDRRCPWPSSVVKWWDCRDRAAPARGGWFLEDLVRAPIAPNGTAELLVDAVMCWAAEAGSSWLTLGLAPPSGNVPVPLRFARKSARVPMGVGRLRPRVARRAAGVAAATLAAALPRARQHGQRRRCAHARTSLALELGHARSFGEHAIVSVACAGPALAALTLWAARRTAVSAS